jgi:lysophospholipase L1-like esterase
MIRFSALLAILAATGPQKAADYADAMKKVAAGFKGKEGVVLHLGDSITYANPYSSWAKYGQGKAAEDQAILKWMHCGSKDDLDGWHLASVDRPGGRSETAASGVRSDEYLAGGKGGLPPLAEILKKYNPRMAVVMLGTNDASAGRPAAQYKASMLQIVDAILANGTIPILSTIPPHPKKEELAKSYNLAIQEICRERKIPMIDYGGEILKRRPADWNGTLLAKDDVHPTAGVGGAQAGSEPTEENLKNSGYLLRGWLSVRKIAEVKQCVLNGK